MVDLPAIPDISLAPALPAAGCSFLSPSFLHIYMSTGISTCCPSTTPLGLSLGPDLPRAGRTFLWKPWVFGAWDSHPRSATHTGILSSMPPRVLSIALLRSWNAPLPSLRIHSFGSMLSPGKLSAQSPRLVSCYALFKGWLLLSQPPSCLYISTSFST